MTESSIAGLVNDARLLIRRALQYYDTRHGFGTMSCTPYDTAWVAMITKRVNGQDEWLFPQSIEYLLSTQSETGGWTEEREAQIDGILNTAAPLLALKRHAAAPLQLKHDTNVLVDRIAMATKSLHAQLAEWDVSTTDHVGFEIIVPAILDLLKAQDASLVFDFASEPVLMGIHDKKMSRFRPEFLYGTQRTTALHSLEAFIGKINFDKVSHHKVNGSMLGSPSSTAAYLMHASVWDTEAEDYLRHVIRFGAGQNCGAVPSAFPSTFFETSWMLSTMLRAGYTSEELHCDEFVQMADILQQAFNHEDGVLGFAPHFEADVDDTAKTISSLTRLGRPVSASHLVTAFEADTHFRTYAGERDPSLTANCNALIALLDTCPTEYAPQIHKIATFVCDSWWKADGQIKDKWNLSPLYPSVLLVEALVDLLEAIESKALVGYFEENMISRIAITLFQACFRPLLNQQDDGSWNHSVEETAYGLLILHESRRLSFFEELGDQTKIAIQRGVNYIEANRAQYAKKIWIEKVSYGSPLLTDSYRLAAARVAGLTPSRSVGTTVWDKSYAFGLHKHVHLFSQASLFERLPRWELHGSMIEAALFLPLLRAKKSSIFPRHNLGDDKYLDVIAFFWTSCNNRSRTYASTAYIYEMSVIALLNFQVDEFMEATSGPNFLGRYDELRRLITAMLADDRSVPILPDAYHDSANNGLNGKFGVNKMTPDYAHDTPLYLEGRDQGYIEVFTHLSLFLNYILQHPYVIKASGWDQRLVKRELKSYLLAHTQQAEDSARSGLQRQNTTFFNWVRTTSADHISCPYSYAFVTCFLGSTLTPPGGGEDCFPTAEGKYLSNAVCRHLSTMCRMYNDLGSVERDRSEGNLNSVDFPEFGFYQDIMSQQQALLRLADYERQAYLDAFLRLEKAEQNFSLVDQRADAIRLRKRRMEIWSMFCEEVDLYGQVYVVRDISSRVLAAAN